MYMEKQDGEILLNFKVVKIPKNPKTNKNPNKSMYYNTK